MFIVKSFFSKRSGFKMFPSTLKSKAGVYRFSPDEERFWKAPFWWGISGDGRPTVQNKATFLVPCHLWLWWLQLVTTCPLTWMAKPNVLPDQSLIWIVSGSVVQRMDNTIYLINRCPMVIFEKTNNGICASPPAIMFPFFRLIALFSDPSNKYDLRAT